MSGGKKIKVLQILDKLGISDSSIHGVSRLLSWWLPEFQNTDCEVVLIELRHHSKATEVFREMGADVMTLGRSKYDPRTLFDLIRIIKQEKADILHCHGYGSTTFGRLAGALTSTPVIVHEHMIDDNIPFYQKMIDRLLAPLTAKGIGVSRAVEIFMTDLRAIKPDRVEVVYSGLPHEFTQTHPQDEITRLIDELGLKREAFRIGITGRLDPLKGHRYLLQAIAALPQRDDIECLIVGDGELREDLEALAGEIGITKCVHFLGYRNDIAKILATFDIQVICSLSEGLSLSMLEGMAAGKAIIATAVGGIPEIITNEVTGLLIPAQDSESLERAIEYLRSDPALRQKLAENARAECLAKYTNANTVKQFVNIYHKLLT